MIDGDLEKAISELKRIMIRSGDMKAIKFSRFYEKKSVGRKRKKRESKKRVARSERTVKRIRMQ